MMMTQAPALVLLAIVGAASAFMAPSGFTGMTVQHAPQARAAPRSAHTCRSMSMKIFDWKRRESKDGAIIEEISAHTLKPAPGSRHRKKRKGRGIAQGQGASCGFGMRGQKSRSGRSVRLGFEGGQTPLYRRLPKFVGRPMGPGHKRKHFNLITIECLNSMKEGSVVNFDELKSVGATTKTKHKWHKVVCNGELTVSGLTVQAHAFTKTAAAAIEAQGGTCQLLSPTTNQVVVMDEEDDEEEEVTVA